MPLEAMTLHSDSQNPAAPLFALHDTRTDEWFIFDDVDLWIDDPLWPVWYKPEDEFAFVCEDCQKPLSECSCPSEPF